jgi:hypothetical protein
VCLFHQLIHAHQNNFYNVVTWNSLLHRRIKPSLAKSLPRLKALASSGHPKLADWAVRYGLAAPEALKRFGHAVEHSTHLFNEKINERMHKALPRLEAFPALEEKCLLILLSTPIHALLTDQVAAFGTLAASIAKLQTKRKQDEFQQRQAAGDNAASSADKAEADDHVPTVHEELQRYLLSESELRTVLDALQTEVSALLPDRIMKDELRKMKPGSIL